MFNVTLPQAELCLTNIAKEISFDPTNIFENVRRPTANTLSMKIEKLYQSILEGCECAANFLKRAFGEDGVEKLKKLAQRLLMKTGVVSVARAKLYIDCIVSGECDQAENFFVELEEVDALSMAYELKNLYKHMNRNENFPTPFLYSYFGRGEVEEIQDEIRFLLDNTSSVIQCSQKAAERSVKSTISAHNFGTLKKNTGGTSGEKTSVAKIRRASRKPSKCITIKGT